MLRKHIPYLLTPTPTDGGGGDAQTETIPAAGAGGAQVSKDRAEPEGQAPAQAEEQTSAPVLSGKDDFLLGVLLKDMKPEIPEIKTVSEEETEAPQSGEPKPQPAKEPAATVEEKPKRKKKASLIRELDAPLAPPVITPSEPAPTAQVGAPSTDPDEEYVKGLTSDQQEELAEAEYAQKLYGETYKGRRKALLKWYRELDATATRLLAEDPERKLSEEDADWQKFMRSKPRMEVAHVKAVQRAIGEDAALKRVHKEYEPKLSELDRKQRELEFQPKIEGVVQEFTNGISDLLAQDKQSPLAEAIRFAREKGEAEAAREFPLETHIRNEEVRRAADMTREYFLFAKQLRAFDEKNPTHTALLAFINEEGRRFQEHGGAMLSRDGKRFLPREDFMRLAASNPAEAGRHWTFSHRDIVEMLAYQTKISIENRLKTEEERAKSMGFERRAKKDLAPAQTAKEAQPLNPPKATPTPSKGTAASRGGGAGSGAKGDPIDVVTTLGMRG